MTTFFSCRLVWGSYQSWNLYIDLWSALTEAIPMTTAQGQANLGVKSLYSSDQFEVQRDRVVPVWLLLAYLVSNTLLSFLNFFWFGKMIHAVRKRFTPTPKTMKQGWKGDQSSMPTTRHVLNISKKAKQTFAAREGSHYRLKKVSSILFIELTSWLRRQCQ